MQRIKGRNVDVVTWADPAEVESVALDQLRNISSLPWVFHHVAAMALHRRAQNGIVQCARPPHRLRLLVP